ncbi:hypothetical protein M231_05108 [Tremella mesenterica]|uniref:Transmembrane protein 135 N-terminal domain-containing protein n=2 Tax=Tremella mesenterica TaxID=5217 RepID=A0A4Q1BJ54_TREME|nr:hypothetical protein M231_05108 [Tremella mesenterica]
MSNTSSRDQLLLEVSRAGRDLVWRKKDERQVYPEDGERAGVLALKRGLRSFILAFSTRAGVNVLLMLFRTFRRKPLRLALFRHAIFGPEPFRFGAMIGTFTFLNTLTLHLLRLAPPWSYYRRRIRAGLFIRPTFGPPEREGPEGERRWQAAVAGAVGSLGLLWEAKSRRAGVAQQLLVRGLQASYNQYTPQFGIHIPYGALLVFGLCSGQIMYSWLLNPETMPKEYNTWIGAASQLPPYAVVANRTIEKLGVLESSIVQRALSHESVTPTNATILRSIAERLKLGWQPDVIPCEVMHPWLDSCVQTDIRRFFSVFRFMLPVYGALHIIPTLVLRSHKVRQSPLKMLARMIWGIIRSCSFLGTFVMIEQTLMCLRTNMVSQVSRQSLWARLMKRKEFFWLLGFSTCLSLLLEEKKRRAELAMYVLPRALESAWSSARRRAWVPIVPFGANLMGAAAMAMLMDSYKHSPESMSGIVKGLLYQLVGPI